MSRTAQYPSLDFRHREGGVIRGDDHVAAGSQYQTGPDSLAIYRRNDRQWTIHDGPEAITYHRAGIEQIDRRIILYQLACMPARGILEIDSGTENVPI